VPPLGVVEAVDPLGDHAARILESFETLAGQKFKVERAEETLDHCVVPRIGLAAHAALDATVRESLDELLFTVNRAAIGVQQHRAARKTISQRFLSLP